MVRAKVMGAGIAVDARRVKAQRRRYRGKVERKGGEK
jgi:hypothetical protein